MRFTKSSAGDSALSKSVVNVHTVCLKDIEELTFSQKTSESQSKAKQQVDSQEAPNGTAAATKDHSMEVPIAGQKRLYVNAAQGGAAEESKLAPKEDVQMRGLKDIIRGLE